MPNPNKPDLEAAILAGTVAQAMDMNINGTSTSRKDVELLNNPGRRLDYKKFLPQKYNPNNPNNRRPQNNAPMPPQTYQNYPQQQPQPQPAMPQSDYVPQSLPSKPAGFIPVDNVKFAEKYIDQSDQFVEENSSEFEEQPVNSPSFQDTNFASPFEEGETKVIGGAAESVLDDLRREVKDSNKEVKLLKKKIQTLSTRALKMCRFIEDLQADKGEAIADSKPEILIQELTE